ncbi:biopolymer transporter ExbD, partial [Herbaspirillum sp.]
VKIELPKVAAEALPVENERQILTLSVKADGGFYWNLGSELDIDNQTDSAVDLAELQAKVGAIIAERGDTQVYVRADEAADYGRVVAGIAELQRGGVVNLGLITEAPAAAEQER